MSLVGGNRLVDRTLAEFMNACEVLLEEEQAKISHDNALISVLCDAVRLAREHISFMGVQIGWEILAYQRRCYQIVRDAVGTWYVLWSYGVYDDRVLSDPATGEILRFNTPEEAIPAALAWQAEEPPEGPGPPDHGYEFRTRAK